MSETTINYHEDAELFRDAIRFTASESGFSERLVEKDYFCTVALADLTAGESNLALMNRINRLTSGGRRCCPRDSAEASGTGCAS